MKLEYLLDDVIKEMRVGDFDYYKKPFSPLPFSGTAGFSNKQSQAVVNKSMSKYAKILSRAEKAIGKSMKKGVKDGRYDVLDIASSVYGDISRYNYPTEMDLILDIWHSIKADLVKLRGGKARD